MSIIVSDYEARVLRQLSRKVPSPVIYDALRSAWRIFLIDSEVWETSLAAIDAVEGTANYELTVPTGQLISVVKVVVDDETIPVSGYYVDEDGELVFEDDYVPSEDITGGIVVTITTAPDYNATDGPAWVASRWADAIISGALMEICGTRGQPWYDPDRYIVHRSKFMKGISEAAGAAIQKRTKRTGFSA